MDALITAARLCEVHDAMKALFGDRYEAEVKPWKEILTKLMDAWGCGPLEAILKINKDMQKKGKDIGESPLIFAAAADLCRERKRNGTAAHHRTSGGKR